MRYLLLLAALAVLAGCNSNGGSGDDAGSVADDDAGPADDDATPSDDDTPGTDPVNVALPATVAPDFQ